MQYNPDMTPEELMRSQQVNQPEESGFPVLRFTLTMLIFLVAFAAYGFYPRQGEFSFEQMLKNAKGFVGFDTTTTTNEFAFNDQDIDPMPINSYDPYVGYSVSEELFRRAHRMMQAELLMNSDANKLVMYEAEQYYDANVLTLDTSRVRPILNDIIPILQEHDEAFLIIVGHTDPVYIDQLKKNGANKAELRAVNAKADADSYKRVENLVQTMLDMCEYERDYQTLANTMVVVGQAGPRDPKYWPVTSDDEFRKNRRIVLKVVVEDPRG